MNVHNTDTITPDSRINKIFKEIDTNSDKKISRAEFIKGCLNDEFLRHLLAPNL
jgi:Ca2+-binding EF-hand superfamily protein